MAKKKSLWDRVQGVPKPNQLRYLCDEVEKMLKAGAKPSPGAKGGASKK